MLQKKYRLMQKEFSKMFSIGRRFNSDLFLLIYVPTPEFKVGVSVSKKIYTHAVQRNSIRRRVYAVMEDLFKKDSCTGTYIFILKKTAQTPTYAIVEESIHSLLKQLH